MNSPHQREQLPDLLSDALEPAERARVESHLAECEQCARELRALQQIQQTLAALPAATPPASLRGNVRAALRENPQQTRALPGLWANRAGNKALPFALPARQLAWGGAVALGAVGLMLLARPSLHNDALTQSAPVSETQLADRALSGAAAPKDVNGSTAVAKIPRVTARSAQTKPKSKKGGSTTALAPKSGARTDGSIDSVASLPALPRTRVAPSENLEPIPTLKAPLPETFQNVAPAFTRNSDGSKPEKRPKAMQKPAPRLQNSPAPKIASDKATQKQLNGQSEAAPATPSGSGATQANSGIGIAGGRALESARADTALDRNSEAPAAPAPPAIAPPAPMPPASAPPAPASRVAPENMMRSRIAKPDAWPGGAVEASIAAAPPATKMGRLGATAPVLKLRVALAIGNARLFLQLPNGETQVWRGSLNAAPVAIALDKMGSKVLSGQKIRARLEQIDDEGNPKSSTTFDLVWP